MKGRKVGEGPCEYWSSSVKGLPPETHRDILLRCLAVPLVTDRRK